MMRELTSEQDMVRVFDDTHVFIVRDPGLIRYHHKLCGGLLIPIALTNDLDMYAVATMYQPCRCRQVDNTPLNRAAIVADVLAGLYSAVKLSCTSKEDVLDTIEKMASPARLKRYE
jgi:hypothetical protein